MPEDVIMPRLSDTMEEGTVLKWLKKIGDQVNKGEPLVEIATDKANMEVEAYESGILDRIDVGEGEMVPVGTPIAAIRKPDEAPSAGAPAAPPQEKKEAGAPTPPPAPAQAPTQELPQAEIYPQAPGREEPTEERPEGRIKASPLARRLAEEHELDLRAIAGTGPGGRITKEDVDEYLARRRAAAPAAPRPAAAPPTPAAAPVPGADVELSRMQQTIVRHMIESKTTAPHFYVTIEANMDAAARLREEANAKAPEDQQLSFNDILVKAAAVALHDFPEVNASYRDGKIHYNDQINIGMAVAVPNGLVVPVIRDADKKTLRQIAAEAKALIERSRAGRPAAEDYLGGTFTVSNLGMFDVEEFIAIINLPQSSILAVGAVKPKPVVVDGEIKVANMMKATLSSDHRVYYGATAAQFLRALKRLLENPLDMLL
ncbi:MAG: dihydrolipoamide acetyltransferase family protein [Chloroflexota bacterium]